MNKNLFNIVLLAPLITVFATGAMELKNKEKHFDTIETYNQKRDWNEIVDIFKEAWSSLECNRPYNENLIEQLFEEYTQDPNITKLMKVMRYKDTTIGFITYYLRELEKQGSVEVMGIAKDHRRKYNGETLLNYAIDEMKNMGATHVLIHVKQDSEPALALYKKRGFEIIAPAFRNLAYLMKLDLEKQKNN